MAEKPLYIELYYRLTINEFSDVSNSTGSEYVNTTPNNTYSGIQTRYMMDKNGKQNNDTITLLQFRTAGSSELLLKSMFYTSVFIKTSKNDFIQGFNNAQDDGSNNFPNSLFQDFPVSYATGIFEGATNMRFYYDNVLLTRRIVITNDFYTKEKTNTYEMLTDMTLYYRLFLKNTKVSNDTVLELRSQSSTSDISLISNRYMSDEEGNQNDNIISYIVYKLPFNTTALIPSIVNETMTIITPSKDFIQATATYNDDGIGEITTTNTINFIVSAANGIFKGYKNIKVDYDNINFTRKLTLTSYFPPKKYENTLPLIRPVKGTMNIILYYSVFFNQDVRLFNNSTIDLLVQSQTSDLGAITTIRMSDQNGVRNDNIICVYIGGLPSSSLLSLPWSYYYSFTITTPQGDFLQASTIAPNNFVTYGLFFQPTNFPVNCASGIFETAKNVNILSNPATGISRLLITN